MADENLDEYRLLDEDAVAEVCAVIRAVALEEILPRFGRLAEGDIEEKAPGDLVTVADRAAEKALSERLAALLPGSRVVGEEAVYEDRGLLGLVQGPDPVWIIDPIDGTENYASGNERFSVLVALARAGELLASWIYIPCRDRMAWAVRGGGAFLDGARLHVAPPPGPDAPLLDLDVHASQPRFWEPYNRAAVARLSRHGVAYAYIDGAGTEYLSLATGKHTSALMTWEFVWDHAAGLLLHAEAGGVTMCADGSPFRLAGGNALPFVAAPDRATALAMVRAMSLDGTGIEAESEAAR